MRKKIVFLFLLQITLNGFLIAQPVKMYRDTSIKIEVSGRNLDNAWTGGFNAPVYASMELNGDNSLDLIVFDWIEGNRYRLYCFVNNRSITNNPWIEAPQYESLFPYEMEGWIRTFDYDCDGDMDIFSYYKSGGLELFRNDYTPGTGISFLPTPIVINSHYGTIPAALFVTRVDMPAITDLDGDGDMDIVGFSNSANFLENNKNLSIDSVSSCGTLNYIYNISGCWGYFITRSSSNSAILPVAPPGDTVNFCNSWPANPFRAIDQNLTSSSQSRHNGSATLLVDLDGDNDKEAIIGDIAGNNLLYIKNCGNSDSAWACSSDSLYPAYDTPAVFPHTFPAAYYFDADNDGNNDLIAANFDRSGDDYNNSWFYRNTTNNTTNIFALSTKRFIANTMVDVGTSSHPVLADINGDGLKDLIIGNDYYSASGIAKLAYYKNIGTSTFAKFQYVTDDLAGLSTLGAIGLYPTFGDLDNDNDMDMLVGEDGGHLIYYQNVGTSTNPNFVFTQANYQSINVSANASPQLIDVDRDGILDLLIGNRNGKVNYYRNTGTLTAPAFSLISNFFGGINVIGTGVAGFSAPCLFETNGAYELLVGSESGYIYHYTNIDLNLAGTFTLEDSMYQNIYEPSRCTPTVSDLDGDSKYDLIIGNLMGGLRLYTQNSLLSVSDNNTNNAYFNLYPNPVSDVLYIQADEKQLSEHIQIEITDIIGKTLIVKESSASQFTININQLTPGTYLCRIISGKSSFCRRFIKE